MRSVKTAEILASTQDLSWVGEKARHALAVNAELVLCSSREMVTQKMEELDHLYVVIAGCLQAMKGVRENERLLEVYTEGSMLGLNELFGIKGDDDIMVIAQHETLMLSFSKSNFDKIMSEAEDTKTTYETLKHSYEAYHFLRYSTYLGEILDALFLIEFVSVFEKKVYQDSDIIFNQGDDPDGFYLCSRGKVKVSVVHDEAEVFTGMLQSGDYFGELALTTDSKRSGTLSAIGETHYYFLSKAAFETLVKSEPRLLEGFQLLAKLAYS
jgi:CRP-like cAMP-binding protein